MARCQQCRQSLGFGITECPRCHRPDALRGSQVAARPHGGTVGRARAMHANGRNGQLELTERTLKISRRGVVAFLGHGLKGEKEILIEHVTSVQFKEAGAVVNGFIQFAFTGGREATRGLFEAALDENTVTFTSDQEPEFRKLKRALDDRRAALRALPQPASQVRGAFDDLEHLARLRDRGVVTEAEFQAKKQQILGL